MFTPNVKNVQNNEEDLENLLTELSNIETEEEEKISQPVSEQGTNESTIIDRRTFSQKMNLDDLFENYDFHLSDPFLILERSIL